MSDYGQEPLEEHGMKLYTLGAQFRVFTVTILAGLALTALGTLVLHYGLTSASVNAENRQLKGEIRGLVQRLAEVEGALHEVEIQRQTLDRMTLAAVHSVIGQTTINAENDGKLYLASLNSDHESKAADESLVVGPPPDLASVASRMEQIKGDAQALLALLRRTTKGVGLRQEVLSAMPSRSPAKGWLSSEFGVRQSPFHRGETMHHGVDIAADIGTPVYATADGSVAFAGVNGSFGNYIRINHGFGISTRYAHNAKLLVKKGQKVRRGDQIGVIGISGHTTGPHVHYEVLVKEQQVDPARFFFEETLAKEPPALAQLSTIKPMGGEVEEATVQTVDNEFALESVTDQEELTAGPHFLVMNGDQLFFASSLPKRLGGTTTTDMMLLTAFLIMLAVASSLIRIPEPRRFTRAQTRRVETSGYASTLGIWANGQGHDDTDDDDDL